MESPLMVESVDRVTTELAKIVNTLARISRNLENLPADFHEFGK